MTGMLWDTGVIQGSSLLYPAHQVAASTTLEAFFDGRVFCEFSRWIYGGQIQLDKGFQRRSPDTLLGLSPDSG